ncbi:MAG: hypothetical protein ACE5HQ_06855 [Gemmatimonadota bacterium]
MFQLVRHQMGAALLAAFRAAGLGMRDLFEGRQEPLSWFFRALAFDQSELDIMESGAVETLHAPSALVELVIDELALAIANVGLEGLGAYITRPPPPGEERGEPLDPHELSLDDSIMLGFLNLDVAPPALWLEERESNPATNDELAERLTRMAQEVGAGSDAVEVHIEGALDPEGGWEDSRGNVRPAGVSVHFSLDIPLVGTGEREMSQILDRGAALTAEALERLRQVFRAG